MRYLSLLAAAFTLAIASGCGYRHAGNGPTPPICATCGQAHYSSHVGEFGQTTSGSRSDGLQLVSVAAEVPDYAGDYGPAQVFEVQGPEGQAIALGRIWPSCSCIQVESGRGVHEAGKPARIVLRQVNAPPADGVTLYVQVRSPSRVLLSADIPVKQ